MRIAKAASTLFLAALLFPACAVFESRPVKQLAYAEAAIQGAAYAFQAADKNPESDEGLKIAKDYMGRARAAYRQKDFHECRKLALRARWLAEEAELRAGKADSVSQRSGSRGK